jgi:hypothetical protein
MKILKKFEEQIMTNKSGTLKLIEYSKYEWLKKENANLKSMCESSISIEYESLQIENENFRIQISDLKIKLEKAVDALKKITDSDVTYYERENKIGVRVPPYFEIAFEVLKEIGVE